MQLAVHFPPSWDDVDAFLSAFWPDVTSTTIGVLLGVGIALRLDRRRERGQRRIGAAEEGRRICIAAQGDLMGVRWVGQKQIEQQLPVVVTHAEVLSTLRRLERQMMDFGRNYATDLSSSTLLDSLDRLVRTVTMAAWVIESQPAEDFKARAAYQVCSNLSAWAGDLAGGFEGVRAGGRVGDIPNEMSWEQFIDFINRWRPFVS